jgi:hypothetical protein
VPATASAACNVGVLVPAPAKSPAAVARDTPSGSASIAATTSAAATATVVSAMYVSPGPRRLAKNCGPYWIPMPYAHIRRPSVPTSAGGAACGAIAPIKRPVKSTAPTPNEMPATETCPIA